MPDLISVPSSIQINNQTDADHRAITNVYFIGQVVGGEKFNTKDDMLQVKATLQYGENWSLIEKESYVNSGELRTHAAESDEEGFHVFAHPF